VARRIKSRKSIKIREIGFATTLPSGKNGGVVIGNNMIARNQNALGADLRIKMSIFVAKTFII